MLLCCIGRGRLKGSDFELRGTTYEVFMSRRKFRKDDRRFLKKAGFGREFKEMGGAGLCVV